MIFIQYVIRSLATLASFSTSSIKYIDHITKTYFFGESLLFVYWSNVSMEFRHELMGYWAKSEIVLVKTCNCDYVTDDIIWERSYVKNTVVLFGDMVPENRHIESIRQCASWNGRSKILAIINDRDNVVNSTLEKIWAFTKAMNVTVMVYAMSSVKYYTSFPYQNFEIAQLDQNGLFPSKPLDDLHGALIKVAMAPCEPYVLIPDIPGDYSDGTEIRMINHMSEKFNFRWEIIKPPNGESPWISLYKGKIVGNFGLLNRREADIAAYGVQIRADRHVLADYTAIHTIDKMVWVVPIRPFSYNWRSIIIVFRTELWGMLFSTLVLIAVTLYLITKHEANSPKTSYNYLDAFFQTFGIHLFVPIHFYRKRQLYRLFIFTISYYTMIIVALYQSSLITYLTTPGTENQYNTIEEAVDDGLVGYLFPSAKPSYNLTDHELWNKILQPGRHVYHELSPTMLGIVAFNKTAYTLVMDGVTYFEVQKNLLDENHKPMVRVLPEIFLPYLATIFTSKGHPLRDLIESQILRFVETGIITHWVSDIILTNFKIYGGAKATENKGPRALTVEQLKGAFYILLFLFTISVVVFMCEVAYNWWKVKRTRKSNHGISAKLLCIREINIEPGDS